MSAPLPPEVRRWPRWAAEEFVHRAGVHMAGGWSVERADRLALAQVRTLLRERGQDVVTDLATYHQGER
jgi:hypothetical protein